MVKITYILSSLSVAILLGELVKIDMLLLSMLMTGTILSSKGHINNSR